MLFSYADFPLADGYIPRANNISDMPELSLLTTILLFVLNLSLIVLISLSIFPYLCGLLLDILYVELVVNCKILQTVYF